MLTLSQSVLAQQPDAAPAAASDDEEEEEGFEEKDSAAAAPEAAAAAGQVEPAQEPAQGPADPPVPAKEAVEADSELAVGVRILPGSGYPEPRIRGIVGGSLWLTMPGHQFPYQPKIAGQSGLQLALSGSVWTDTSYAKFESGTPETEKNQNRWANQTRGVLRATPVYSTEQGWFVQGNAEFVANGDQTVPTTGNMGLVDDLYVRFGKWDLFDITAGRFQGWEIYHYGMGLDQNTFERRGAETQRTKPPRIYGADFFWDRPDGGGGNYAAHVYPTDFLRFELLGQFGTRTGGNVYGVRGTGIFDLGFVKVKAGGEKGSSKAQEEGAKYETSWNGWGAAVQGVFNPYLEGGVSGAIGYVDSVNVQGLPDLPNSTTTKSFGGFINGHPPLGSLILGGGLHYTMRESLDVNQVATSPNFGKANQHKHTQWYVAAQYAFWDRLFFKLVAARASYDFEDVIQDPAHPFTNKMVSYRFRIMYNF
jgi:hypothetical protein